MGFWRRRQNSGVKLKHATEQFELGAHYYNLRTGNRRTNLQRSIECFTQMLRFYTADTFPLGYAATQWNLGAAYAELPGGDRAANLARAIGCYGEALRF
jgi:hypothetical protein